MKFMIRVIDFQQYHPATNLCRPLEIDMGVS